MKLATANRKRRQAKRLPPPVEHITVTCYATEPTLVAESPTLAVYASNWRTEFRIVETHPTMRNVTSQQR